MNKPIAVEFKIKVETPDIIRTLHVLNDYNIHFIDIDDVVVGCDYTELECRADTRDDLDDAIQELKEFGVWFEMPE